MKDNDKIILSIHIPKTGGTTFRNLLEQVFGEDLYFYYPHHLEHKIQFPEKNVFDYSKRRIVKSDFPNEDYLIKQEDYTIPEKTLKCIHGHFRTDKFSKKFTDAEYITWFRDPVQALMSGYKHAVRHPEDINERLAKALNGNLEIENFMNSIIPNPQKRFICKKSLDDFKFIGITEEYERSIKLFCKIFDIELPEKIDTENINPDREKNKSKFSKMLNNKLINKFFPYRNFYKVSSNVRNIIISKNPEDVKLYKEAKLRFAALCKQYRV